MKKITVCVPVLKRYDLLRGLVLSLKDSTVRPQFCVIDNGGDKKALDEAFYETGFVPTVYRPGHPMGLAESWNWFIQHVEEDRLISNDDLTFSPDSLEKIVATEGDFVSPLLGQAYSCFLLRNSCEAKIGLFDETISPGYAYFEDCDYSERMVEAGFCITHVDAGVAHVGSSTISKNTPEEWKRHHHLWLVAQSNFIKKWGRTPDVGADRVAKMEEGPMRTSGTITFIVPTLGKLSLGATLQSIETLPGDEILVVADMTANAHLRWFSRERPEVKFVHCPPGGDWGHAERNFATPLARGQYIAHIDDDDIYAPGMRAMMADAIRQTPGRPVIFRMKFPNGITLWREPVVRCGNLGTPCFLIPNMPTRLGQWGSFVGGDCHFLETSKWKAEDYVWRPEVVAYLGHDIGA